MEAVFGGGFLSESHYYPRAADVSGVPSPGARGELRRAVVDRSGYGDRLLGYVGTLRNRETFLLGSESKNAHLGTSFEFSSIKKRFQRIFSGEDIPESPPSDFQIIDLHNFSSIKVSWKPVDPSTVRGHFKGYKLVYWLREKPYFSEVVKVEPSVTSFTITGLSAMQNYTIQAHTINSGYESAPSEPIKFETPEGAPSKVHNLRVIPVGATTILALWDPPLRPNGILRG